MGLTSPKNLCKLSRTRWPFENHKRLAAVRPLLLSGRDWVYLASLLVPLVSTICVLKGIRIRSQDDVLGAVRRFSTSSGRTCVQPGVCVPLGRAVRPDEARVVCAGLSSCYSMRLRILVVGTRRRPTSTSRRLARRSASTSSCTRSGRFGEIKDVIGSVTSPAVWSPSWPSSTTWCSGPG